MKSLTPVVPLTRGHNQCESIILMSSVIKSVFAESRTNHSPFIKGGRGIQPLITPSVGRELTLQLASLLVPNKDYLMSSAGQIKGKEIDI